MKRIVEAGSYDDPREFVQTAIENQIELEEGGSNEAKTLEEALSAVDAEVDATTQEVSGDPQANQSRQRSTDKTVSSGSSDETEISLTRRGHDELPTVDPPAESRLDDGPLWGQYNRIFPVKVVVRGLANELLDGTEQGEGEEAWLALPAFRRRIAAIAREVGTDVALRDEEVGRNRGEKLAAGLPTGDDAEKSTDRFQTHFVGRVEREDELTGAPPHLSLVDIASGTPQRIGLTDAGREFASLYNPLLDEGSDADQALSREERRFYVSQVRDVREDEYAAMQKVAQAIAEGDDRPSSLTERVAYIDTRWSTSQAETIRSGLTSRMYELGLLDRRRVGQRGIAYELTNEGEAFRTEGTAFVDTDRGDEK